MARSGIKVTPAGHESGEHRFPKSRDTSSPKICKWRCNLTALSQFRNLYFVAYRDEIFVYQPQYPDQKIPSKPAGMVKLDQSRPQLSGYIDRSLPQGINHLIIRELGDEEILLLACDGGDIIGYTIRDIERSIQQDPGTDSLQVKPFFNENVGESGWGLDVHKSERLIAVSSNSHDIQIFAFALSEDNVETHREENPFEQASDVCFNDLNFANGQPMVSSRWKARTKVQDCYRRHELDFAWTLWGHNANIPSIAFYNEPDGDPEKVFLASTDIDGVTRLWSVWQNVSTSFTFPNQMGWAVSCINRATARIVSSKTEAYGCIPVKSGHEQHLPYINISKSVENVLDNSRKCPNIDPNVDEPPIVAVNTAPLTEDIVTSLVEADFSDEEDLMDVIAYDEGDEDLEEGEMQLASPDDEEWSHPVDDLISPRRKTRVNQITNFSADDVSKTWPCNVFVTLDNDLLFTSVEPKDHSMVWCRDGIRQQYEPSHCSKLMVMQRFERMNMIHQIPELGIVIIGSQVGRVAILTMTYYADKKRYGFKIEAIVPYKSQEDQNLRVLELLLGIAVSPIQGCQPKAYSPSSSSSNIPLNRAVQQRRYRLLLYYYDHTILSYEIAHSEDDGLLIF